MMTFGEQFPELVGIASSRGWVHTSYIELACLSKQRTKHTIHCWFGSQKDCSCADTEGRCMFCAEKELLKELGMEEK